MRKHDPAPEILEEGALFLGLPLTAADQRQLAQVAPAVRALFIQEGDSPYLQILNSDGVLYLGKSLGPVLKTEQLVMMQAHVSSLIRRILPDCAGIEPALVLLATLIPDQRGAVP